MSQTAFLEDVVGWDKQRCMQHVDEALPKLMTCLQGADTAEEEIGILKIICHSFLPCVKEHEAETKVFSKITSKTCDSFNKVISSIKTTVQEQHPQTDAISSSIAMALEVLECIEGCIRHLLNTKQQLELAHIHSLPQCTIHLLSQSYIHCRDSADLYKDLLGMLSEPLSVFFRKSHSLQMAFLNLLDQTTVTGEVSDQDVKDLCQVCDGLYEVCQIVTALDMKVVVSLWKAVSKLASQYKELLQGHLDVCRMVRYLCREVTDAYQYLFQLLPQQDGEGVVQSQGDEKAFLKSVKILGFQMKILVLLVKDFNDFLGQCETALFSLIINIHRLFPPSLCAPKLDSKHLDHINSQVMVAVDPLVTNLLGNRNFRHCVTKQETDLTEDRFLPLLLLQLMIMEMLPKIPDEDQSRWINPVVNTEDVPVNGIVQAAFASVGKCFVELAVPVYLPGVIVSGKKQRQVSLYDYTCTHLCGFVGSFPAKHFSVLEEALLTNCLSQNPFQAHLATDCWCFMARYGSADLCHSHVSLLLQLYQDVTSLPHSHLAAAQLATVIHRLIKFLAPQHQQQDLLKEYPPSQNIGLWSEIPLTALTSSITRDVTDQLISSFTKSIHNWNNSSDKRLSQLHSVNVSLTCLNNLYSTPSVVEKFVTPQQQSLILDKLNQMWKIFTVSEFDNRPVIELTLASLYRLSSHLVRYLNTADILQILTVTQKLLVCQASVLLRLELVSFLQKCGAAKLAPSFEQNQVLHKLADVFSQVLKDPHSVIHHQSLVAFTRFAEETVHESVVPECMEKDSSLQDKVVAFLNKVPNRPSCNKQTTVEYLKDQLRALDSPVCVTQHTSGSENSSYEPANKRPRTESSGNLEESRRHKVLQQLQTVYSEVESLCRSAQQPTWFVSSVQQTIKELSQCLQNKSS